MPLTVVSIPAESSERTSSGASSAVISPAIDAGVDAGAETAGREVLALALRGHIGLMRRRALDRVLAQLVRRPECVEHQARVGQQILASLLLQAHRIGKDRQRIGFREIGDGIKALPRQQFVDLGVGGRGEVARGPAS